jgi:DNA-binding transcriptional ArsR family regulator
MSRRQTDGDTSGVFAALGDHNRLALLARLSSQGPLSISQLAAGGDISRQAVTKHLHILQDAGLIDGARHGREQIWQLRPSRLVDAQRFLDSVSREWDGALARLRRYVEEPK